MGRHLAAVTLPFAFREIIQGQLAGCDPATENESPVPIIGNDLIAFDHRDADRGQPLMSHPGNVKMTLALAIQVLLAEIAMATLQQDRKQTQFVFFRKSGHDGAKMVDRTGPTLNSRCVSINLLSRSAS